MNPEHRQLPYNIRFDWGRTGADVITPGADISVVVDVLSFTTSLSIAIDAGINVFPYDRYDTSADQYAKEKNATLAVRRGAHAAGSVSLSPDTIRSAHGMTRLVLPSPNGSTIARALNASASHCLGASLRNAHAVASWIAQNFSPGTVVSVIAAGERWPDGSLRPAAEDLWGAGAVIAHLLDECPNWTPSPEAELAALAWRGVADRISTVLHQSASGRELIALGYAVDVEIAAEVDKSQSVPLLIGDRFQHAHGAAMS